MAESAKQIPMIRLDLRHASALQTRFDKMWSGVFLTNVEQDGAIELLVHDMGRQHLVVESLRTSLRSRHVVRLFDRQIVPGPGR